MFISSSSHLLATYPAFMSCRLLVVYSVRSSVPLYAWRTFTVNSYIQVFGVSISRQKRLEHFACFVAVCSICYPLSFNVYHIAFLILFTLLNLGSTPYVGDLLNPPAGLTHSLSGANGERSHYFRSSVGLSQEPSVGWSTLWRYRSALWRHRTLRYPTASSQARVRRSLWHKSARRFCGFELDWWPSALIHLPSQFVFHGVCVSPTRLAVSWESLRTRTPSLHAWHECFTYHHRTFSSQECHSDSKSSPDATNIKSDP